MLTKKLLDNSKRERILLNVEYHYVTRASGVGVYLISIPELKDSIPEKIAVLIIKLFCSYSVAYFASLWLVQSAFMKRGYEAYGGEYILVVLIFLFSYYMIHTFFKYFRRTKIWTNKE